MRGRGVGVQDPPMDSFRAADLPDPEDLVTARLGRSKVQALRLTPQVSGLDSRKIGPEQTACKDA